MPTLFAAFLLPVLLSAGQGSVADLSGRYEMRQGDMGGTLVVSLPDALHVRVDLELVNEKTAHLGVLEGLVLELRNGIAVYENNAFGACKITFWFLGGSVRVEEDPARSECDFGVGIYATGSYLKAGLFQFNDETSTPDALELDELRRISPDFAAADDALARAVKAFRKDLHGASRKAFNAEQKAWVEARYHSALQAGPKGSQPYVDQLLSLTRERTTVLTVAATPPQGS
jgi:uncharacterized protein YecT (DUF1311 family)